MASSPTLPLVLNYQPPDLHPLRTLRRLFKYGKELRCAAPRRPLASTCCRSKEGGNPTQGHEQKDFNRPDEVHTFDKGRLERVNVGGIVVQRLVLEPGWRSLDATGSQAATAWRRTPHLLYHAAGRIRIVTTGGDEFEAGPGEVISLAPGHEAYVLGEDPVVIVDFYGAIGPAGDVDP